MLHHSIHFLPDQLIAVYTIHEDKGESEMDFICTCTISKQQAQNIIDSLGLVYVSYMCYNTPVHWIPKKSIIFKEPGNGKVFPIGNYVKKHYDLLTHLLDQYGQHYTDHDRITANSLIAEISTL